MTGPSPITAADPADRTPPMSAETQRDLLLPRAVLTETSRYDVFVDGLGVAWIRRTPGAGLGTLPGVGRQAQVVPLVLDALWEPLVEVVQLELGAPLGVLVLRDNEIVARGSTVVREIHRPVGQRPCEHTQRYQRDGSEGLRPG